MLKKSLEKFHTFTAQLKGTKNGFLASFRLVGIYGPYEQRHLPRTISAIRQGYMKVNLHKRLDRQLS